MSVSGEKGYIDYSITLNTNDYITFTYTKDNSTYNGSDKAYIKNIKYISLISCTTNAKCVKETEYYEYSTNNSIMGYVEYDTYYSKNTKERVDKKMKKILMVTALCAVIMASVGCQNNEKVDQEVNNPNTNIEENVNNNQEENKQPAFSYDAVSK